MGIGGIQEKDYTQVFNLKDAEDIRKLKTGNSTSYGDALEFLNSNSRFNALMWILDNCYIPNTSQSETDKEVLLNAVKNYANGDPEEQNIIEAIEEGYLTDDDIDAVQQLAIWYYTNTDSYHMESFSFDLLLKNGSTTSNMGSMADVDPHGDERQQACIALYYYLIETAQANATNYDSQASGSTQRPVQFANTTINMETQNGRLIIGPYRITRNRNIEHSLTGSVLDGSSHKVTDVIILDDNKNQTNYTMQDLSGLIEQNFYISIPENVEQSEIKLQINGSYNITNVYYWSVNETYNLDKEQPVVRIEKRPQPFEDIKTYVPEQIEPEKEFDLALRKFITSINGAPMPENREPEISNTEIEALKNKTKKTANKVHDKTPLLVEVGNTVLYTIRVYNEGEIAGYATQITDYLPAGLEYLPNSNVNKKYQWTPSADGKTITTNYLADKELAAFNGTEIKYIDLQIECKVVATVSNDDQILKNVAEITAHKDEQGNTSIIDRDSRPNSLTPTDIQNYGTTSKQDDDDYEDLILMGDYFDLALRKFITSVENANGTKTYNRAPVVDTMPLLTGDKTANYNHSKKPVSVSNGNIVTYTIRVYNEGNIDGYVTEITDHIPEQLEFIVNDTINAKYGWTVSPDGKTVKTTITSPRTTSSANSAQIYADRTTQADKLLLKAAKKVTDAQGTKLELDYIDVQIRCKVKDEIDLYQKITNFAQITDFRDATYSDTTSQGSQEPDFAVITDRDSQKDNGAMPQDFPTYKDPEIAAQTSKNEYIKGFQDDDDFEKLVLQRFDLALRKFITGVNDQEITSRAPVFNKISNTEFKYTHPKDPVEVANGNIVTYTLRIFNEGNVAGYATAVRDNLPEGLEFLPQHETNIKYRWDMYKEDGTKTENIEEASYIQPDYLSKELEPAEGANLIESFNPETMTMPNYKDIKIAFKVTEPNTSDRIIINTAEIADDSDEDGNEIEDIDSEPANGKEEEDDIDIEKIKVKYFDLSLKKWVTESIVTYNGKTTVTKTGHTGDENPEAPAKVELKSKDISKTSVKFKFNIKVTNEGEIAGYAKELIDYIPEGLKFVQADNPNWREEDGKVLTNQLKDTLLQPGESATVEIILTWINGKDNLGLKTNWAEIYEDYNEYDSPDIDSTPGNKIENEDDIDQAPVILSVVTGSIPTYITLMLASISMVAGGVILIKKFVI